MQVLLKETCSALHSRCGRSLRSCPPGKAGAEACNARCKVCGACSGVRYGCGAAHQCAGALIDGTDHAVDGLAELLYYQPSCAAPGNKRMHGSGMWLPVAEAAIWSASHCFQFSKIQTYAYIADASRRLCCIMLCACWASPASQRGKDKMPRHAIGSCCDFKSSVAVMPEKPGHHDPGTLELRSLRFVCLLPHRSPEDRPQ